MNASVSANVGARPRSRVVSAATVSACESLGYSFKVTGTPSAVNAAARLTDVMAPRQLCNNLLHHLWVGEVNLVRVRAGRL